MGIWRVAFGAAVWLSTFYLACSAANAQVVQVDYVVTSGLGDELFGVLSNAQGLDRAIYWQRVRANTKPVYRLATDGHRSSYTYLGKHFDDLADTTTVPSPHPQYFAEGDVARYSFARADDGVCFQSSLTLSNDWAIQAGKRDTIAGYPVVLAVHEQTSAEAWFAPSLPFPVGPEAYAGLPGLVLRIVKKGGVPSTIEAIAVEPGKGSILLVNCSEERDATDKSNYMLKRRGDINF